MNFPKLQSAFVVALITVATNTATADELNADEMLNTRGGVSVTSWVYPSTVTKTDIDSDNILMFFGIESSLNSNKVLMQIYNGNTKMGSQEVPTTTVLANGNRSGVYVARLNDGPLRDFTSTTMRMDVKFDDAGQEKAAAGTNFRNVNIHDDIVVRYVKFHLLREPDGDQSVFSVLSALDIVDSTDATYAVSQYDASSADAVLMSGDCDLVSERTNLRACTAAVCGTALIDTINVQYDGMTTPPFNNTTWVNRFKELSNSLTGGSNVYHVFIVTDITTPGYGAWASFNDNYMVIEAGDLTWMKRTLVHELGHSQGMEHSNVAENNCNNVDQTVRNVMCGGGDTSYYQGARVKQSQCAQYRNGNSGLHDYN